MKNKKNQLLARLDRIVEISYEILKGKIVSGGITVQNEASLQLQFGVILKQVGTLFEYDSKDHFEIILEEVQDVSTIKSPKGARCDIMLRLCNCRSSAEVSAAIELKFFKATDGKTETITQNRRSVYLDVENLEEYRTDLGYELVYTNNGNYPNPDSRSVIRLGDGETMRTINDGMHDVILESTYDLKWDCYNEAGEACKDYDKRGDFFLLIPVK